MLNPSAHPSVLDVYEETVSSAPKKHGKIFMTTLIYSTGGNMSEKKQLAYFYNARLTEDESQVDLDSNLKVHRLAAWNQWFMYLAGKMRRISDEAPVNREYDLFEKLPDGSTSGARWSSDERMHTLRRTLLQNYHPTSSSQYTR
jgi:hypothetical protein